MTDTVLAQLDRTTARTPDAPAVVAGATTLTFRQLADGARSSAAALAELGVCAGDRVGVCMAKSVEHVVAILGVLAARAVVVPLHPTSRATQVEHACADSGMTVLVTDPARAAELAGRTSPARLVIGAGPDRDGVVSLKAVRERASVLPATAPEPDDDAAILYTSGSTGPPKGIVVPHRNLADGARVVAGYLGTTDDDRIAGLLPLSSDYGLNQLWQVLLTGASLHLHDLVFPRDVFRLVAERRLTALPLMPVLVTRLFEGRAGGPEPGLDVSSLRYVCSTGGTVTPSMLAHLERTFPAADIVLMYGLTEAFRSTFLPPEQLAARPTSIGRAIPGVEVLVLDEEGRECPAGVTGELVHRGGGVARGYWNAPEATAERFRTIDRFPDETVVFSGDLVRRDEAGYLYFVGRRDAQIKTHGFRVSPTEVESHALLFPGVQHAVAFGVDEPAIGQHIALVYGTEDAAPADDAALLEHFRRAMPPHLVPREVLHLDRFPVTTHEVKIDRAAVRAWAVDRLPSGPGST